MFWPNLLPSSGVGVVEETAAPLSCCYTLHFKGIQPNNILKIILKYFVSNFTPLKCKVYPGNNEAAVYFTTCTPDDGQLCPKHVLMEETNAFEVRILMHE
jgi:hypothetical protein